MKNCLFVFISLWVFLLPSCQSNTPSQRRVVAVDTVFTQAVVEAHSNWYRKLERHVFSLDLYSQGLVLHGDTLTGTGTNLYFSDIFLDTLATRLQEREGEYKVDSSANVRTALSAMTFEGDVTGTYLLLIADGALQKMYTFPSGTFTLQQLGDTSVMEFHLRTADQQTYDATYRGVLTDK